MMNLLAVFVVSCIACLGVIDSNAEACTGLRVRLKAGGAVHGRTLEFGFPLDSHALCIPKGVQYQGTLPDQGVGMRWTAAHAVIGMSAATMPLVVDGMNDVGLSGGLFYFPGFASYPTPSASDGSSFVAPHEFLTWALTSAASIDELRAAIKEKRVQIAPTPVSYGSINGVQEVHFAFYDRDGSSIVVEPTRGALVIHDNPLGVCTNSPTFDWHMTNLRNYSNLKPVQGVPLSLQSRDIDPMGQGSSLYGMPGDFTPSSRFVRAAVFSSSAPLAESHDAAVAQAFHLLNQFDLPDGSAGTQVGPKVYYDITEWTVVRDPAQGRYYFRTRENQNIGWFDAEMFGAMGTQPVFLDLPKQQTFAPLVSQGPR